jgi:DNA-binding GntR family transcriptional regulator
LKNNISTYIRDDLRSKILSGAEVPGKLTLPALAQQYQVSVMPVRIAVQELLEEKLLSKLENGRLAVNQSKFGSRPGSPAAETPAPPQDVYQVVMRDVLAKSLRGEATPLKIVACAKEFGISRSLMHTVLHRLAGEGLVEHTPRYGWSIRPFRQRDLDSYVDVRESLELLALDSSRDKLETGKLQALLDLNQPDSARKQARIDNSLHAYWVEKSDNRYIQDFFQRHQAYYDMLLMHAVVRRTHIELSKASHRRILEALINKDWSTARSELVQDIRRLSPLLKTTIQRLEGKSLEDEPLPVAED